MNTKTSQTAPNNNRTFSQGADIAGNLYTKAAENNYWNKITEHNVKLYQMEMLEKL